jgi:phosphoglycerate dehydrogenase-like enzyme
MKSALVDQDIQPYSVLEKETAGRLDIDIGVEETEDAIVESLAGKEVLLATSRLPVTASVLERSPELEAIGKIGTGLDSVDLEAAAELGIPVTYTPGLNAASVAEHTVGLAIAVARDVVPNHDLLKEGKWRDEVELSSTVVGKTVGIVGFGDIGSRVAAFFSGFNVDVLAYDPYVYPEDTEITGAELTSLEDLLRESDIVTVNAELTPETRGLIGEREFDLMDESAILVNTARGPIVSESALVDTLESGGIAGAGLDVFETEPLPPSSPLHEFDNVVATPHAGAMTEQSRTKGIETLVDNVLDLLDGEPVADRYVAVGGDR